MRSPKLTVESLAVETFEVNEVQVHFDSTFTTGGPWFCAENCAPDTDPHYC
ncbi:hypothetical protein FHS01_001429 [Longimicrobium terrae]|uniref:Lantibiotic n=1 Tax=Longimicrobium terrae TaxID=1639882 RepID=A0A841GM03_9BACT|nr:hypothetical protein [Longimicrobium terrae]MBB6069811.1 hypothetical protein [Longimicrobium terrae]